MQTMARKNAWPLDQTCLTVDVTKKSKEDYGHPPREGAYLHGLFMEGRPPAERREGVTFLAQVGVCPLFILSQHPLVLVGSYLITGFF